MSFILGIDTGGTYTDGVIVDSNTKEIIKKVKTLTTKSDLVGCLQNCIDGLNFEDMDKIKLVSISTTLATNAVIEGKGAPVGLLYMGDLSPVNVPAKEIHKIEGKMDIMGNEISGLNYEEIRSVLRDMDGKIDALIISGYASVRNPKHEKEVEYIAKEELNVPIVCGYQLSTALGFQERTVTAVLNGRLIKTIHSLILSIRQILNNRNISAQIMIVKGDGTLMTEDEAIKRPIETILSGPSASVMGGVALTGNKNGLVLDMGGTTCDLALVKDGVVKIKKEGAKVAGWRTRVQAGEISTYGLGGDSKIYLDSKGHVCVSEERVHPLCIIGEKYPSLLSEIRAFTRSGEIKKYYNNEADCFIRNETATNDEISLTEDEIKILQALDDGPHSVTYLAKKIGTIPETFDPCDLVKNELISRISLTPTDLLHVDGEYNAWNRNFSQRGFEILARRRDAKLSEILSEARSAIKKKLAMIILQAIADFDGRDIEYAGSKGAMELIDIAFGEKSSCILKPHFEITEPIIAIGAPAEAWIKQMEQYFNVDVIVPEDADVANAYGAAVGVIAEKVEIEITAAKGGFIMNTPWDWTLYKTMEEAMFYAIHEGRKSIEKRFASASCSNYKIAERIEEESTTNEATGEKIHIAKKVIITGIGSL